MNRVITIFKELCAIPHGSGNMDQIADYCVSFARQNHLEAFRDEANNVIIKKAASADRKDADAVILQGHLDMVCQKEEGVEIDFEKEGITPVIEGDFMKAQGTTLGADNGIAVAMILALLEREDLSHPAIEAVLTTDEEIGLLGAGKLDFSLLSGRRLINLDSEEEDTVTVSCAGGSDLVLICPVTRERKAGFPAQIKLYGLQGGHSGMEINKGRINADLFMGRLLSALAVETECSLILLEGGEKVNAIPFICRARLLVSEPEVFRKKAEELLCEMKKEIALREENFAYSVSVSSEKEEREAVGFAESQRIFDVLCSVPNGIMEKSPTIPDLVETSLNLGVLKTEDAAVKFRFMLRSNIYSAMLAMEERVKAFARLSGAEVRIFGHYPPWEYRPDSPLRDLYVKLYREETGKEVRIEAIHAGLECGVISAGLPGLDCISIGPDLFDVHTPKERMSLSSVERVYGRLRKMLSEL